MNYASQPLQRHEIRFMRAEPTIIQRVLQSYRLMLDFYGMRLVSADTGLIERVLPPRNYEARYQNLLREFPDAHNDLSENTHSNPLPGGTLRIHSQQSPNHANPQMSVGARSRAAERRLPAARSQ